MQDDVPVPEAAKELVNLVLEGSGGPRLPIGLAIILLEEAKQRRQATPPAAPPAAAPAPPAAPPAAAPAPPAAPPVAAEQVGGWDARVFRANFMNGRALGYLLGHS